VGPELCLPLAPSSVRQRERELFKSHCTSWNLETGAGAGVFSDILNVTESYALGSRATVFKSEVYAILACSEYCISVGIFNRVVSICSDSRAALF
jgi:hypothetical protein